MKHNIQILFFIFIALSTILCQRKDGSYEFGFNIDGEQHRHEKKDENGIVQGEFGFITADGIYHVTVYATDENGKFKILSMKNLRISAPLDGSPLRGEISPEANKYRKQAGLAPLPPPTPAAVAPPPNPHVDPAITDTNPKPVTATEKPAGVVGCANCIIYTTPPPTPPQPQPQLPPLDQQRPSVAVDTFNPNQNNENYYQQLQTPFQGTNYQHLVAGAEQFDTGDQGFVGDAPFVPVSNNDGFNAGFDSAGLQPGFVNSNPLVPQNPLSPDFGSNPVFGIPDSIGGASVYPQEPSAPQSTLPPINVADGAIHVGGENPQVIPIKDKFSGMQPGLPNGIEENDVTGLLYKFHYTVGFHGHYEKGLKNGAKIGGYFVNGRDGISRVVTYTADENGYRAKVKYVNLGLDSDDTPKPETEKTFGLKSFEFIWYPLN